MEIASIIKISLITATGETVLQTLLSRAKKKGQSDIRRQTALTKIKEQKTLTWIQQSKLQFIYITTIISFSVSNLPIYSQ